MTQHTSSFRDDAGFLFWENGRLLRQINKSYQANYEFLMQSGLYDVLREKGKLISHHEHTKHPKLNADAYKIIEPESVSFISYPYEWSFSQLRDAAQLTLDIQKQALAHGMTLRDASSYNIQFYKGRPVFIDTLSFEKYHEGTPWAAYGQFCRHFLAPLALMSYTDLRLNRLMSLYIDGIPLDMAARLLPFKSKLSFSQYIHIHLHAHSQKKYAQKPDESKKVTISKKRLESLILGLNIAVQRLKLKTQQTEWGDYYAHTNYTDTSFDHKKELLASYIDALAPQKLWDLGANTGEFTRIAADRGAECIAFDIDPLAVDACYRIIKKNKIHNMLPLIMDLTNPSPAIGWGNEERMSFTQRQLPDTVLALAIIHHLAIANNLPLSKIAEFFSKLGKHLIIEFVPKSDSQVQRMLSSRKDIFSDYSEEHFVREFSEFYTIKQHNRITDSERKLFLMERRQ